MKTLCVAVCLQAFFLLPLQDARAESPATPVIAKQRKLVYQMQPDGSKVLKHQEVGVFYRSSSGAVMNTMGKLSTFIDEQGNAYEISAHSKNARFVERQELPHLRKVQGIMGHETVNGFDCGVRTVLVNGKPGGKSYWSQQLALTIKWDVMFGDSETVREIYEVTFAEPDESLLRIPEGYSIDNQSKQ